MTDLKNYRFFIDSPKPLLAIAGGMELNGWCFDRASAEIPQISLVIGERRYRCESGRPRPDVGAAFPDFPQAANSGFFLRTWLPLGYHSAHLEFSNDGSQWLRSEPLPLCVELAPLVAGLDSGARNRGDGDRVALSGWALHPQERIAQLSMIVGN